MNHSDTFICGKLFPRCNIARGPQISVLPAGFWEHVKGGLKVAVGLRSVDGLGLSKPDR